MLIEALLPSQVSVSGGETGLKYTSVQERCGYKQAVTVTNPPVQEPPIYPTYPTIDKSEREERRKSEKKRMRQRATVWSKGWSAVSSKVAEMTAGLGLDVIFHSCLIGPACEQMYCPGCGRRWFVSGWQNI